MEKFWNFFSENKREPWLQYFLLITMLVNSILFLPYSFFSLLLKACATVFQNIPLWCHKRRQYISHMFLTVSRNAEGPSTHQLWLKKLFSVLQEEAEHKELDKLLEKPCCWQLHKFLSQVQAFFHQLHLTSSQPLSVLSRPQSDWLRANKLLSSLAVVSVGFYSRESEVD